jgi:Lar family restriction alleviation protein
MKTKLFPCPFCGSIDIVHRHHFLDDQGKQGGFMECLTCSAYGPYSQEFDKEVSIRKWNKRMMNIFIDYMNNTELMKYDKEMDNLTKEQCYDAGQIAMLLKLRDVFVSYYTR